MYDLIVIGSGLSSICFFDTLETKNRKIAVISYNNKQKSIYDKKKKNNIAEKNLPPKFSIKEKNNLDDLNNFFKKNNINFDKKTSIFGLLSEGGVSNYWGCSCQFLYDEDINFLNDKNKNSLTASFENIYKKFKFTGIYNQKKINSFKIKEKNLNQKFSSLFNNCSDEKIKYYNNCTAVDSSNDKLFIPKNYTHIIDEKAEKLNYFVRKIIKENDIYKIYCELNDHKIIIKTKKLVLATGTISTTKLVSEMTNYSKEINLDHNPMLFGVFLGKRNIESDIFLPSDLAAELNLNKNNLTALANFRPSNEIIKKKIFENYFFMKNILSKKIYQLFDKKMIFLNLYLDSEYSCLKLVKSENNQINIKLKSESVATSSKELNKYFNSIYENLRSNNLIYPFKYSYIPYMGNDNHYTGTIPINGLDELSVDENCELKNYTGLHIVDGSVIPKNNLKFPTGLIMANASRIGKIL